MGLYCQQNQQILCIVLSVLSAIGVVMVLVLVVSAASALPIFASHAYIFRIPAEKFVKKNRLEILDVAITVAVSVAVFAIVAQNNFHLEHFNSKSFQQLHSEIRLIV